MEFADNPGPYFSWQKTYGSFLNSDEGISTNILADRLSSLERKGLVTKNRPPENRRIYNYELTERGKALVPVLVEMILWGADHGTKHPKLTLWASQIKNNKKKMIADTLNSLI